MIAVAALFAAPSSANAQAGSASDLGVSSAQVVSPIAVREIADLDFGVIAAGAATPGSVKITPGEPAALYSGGAQHACDASCAMPHYASFEVSGEASRAYTIAAPASVDITGTPYPQDPGSPAPPVLQIDQFEVRSASRPQAGPAGQLDTQGHDTFDLGGTLRLPSGVPAARYRVSIAVVVNYS